MEKQKSETLGQTYTKPCNTCGEHKTLDNFTRSKMHKGGHINQCKACAIEYRKAIKADPIKRKKDREWKRAYDLKKKFGMTLDDYHEMLESQGGCAICGTKSPKPQRYFDVDHDHITGDVRGLLCRQCNAGIGQLKDDPEILQKAINYLRGKQHAYST